MIETADLLHTTDHFVEFWRRQSCSQRPGFGWNFALLQCVQKSFAEQIHYRPPFGGLVGFLVITYLSAPPPPKLVNLFKKDKKKAVTQTVHDGQLERVLVLGSIDPVGFPVFPLAFSGKCCRTNPLRPRDLRLSASASGLLYPSSVEPPFRLAYAGKTLPRVCVLPVAHLLVLLGSSGLRVETGRSFSLK